MANTYKVLGQLAPAANTLSTLFTATNPTVGSTIVICNTGTSVQQARIAVRPAAEALDPKHYLVFDLSVNPYDTTPLTLGITLEATDVVSVQSTGNVSFSLFGTEVV